MADYNYAYNGPTTGTARAVLKDAPVSSKVAIEIAKHLKGKTTEAAKALLERVIKHQEAIPYTRFTDGVGHKRGPMAAGRYPEKAAAHFLQLITTAEANANNHNLSAELKIIHLLAHKASSPFHFGRLRRRQMKRSHIEIVVQEQEEKAAKKASAKKTATKQPEKKASSKPATKTAALAEKKEEKTAEQSPSSQPAKEDAPQ